VELFGSDSEFCQVAEYEGRVVGFVMGTTISKRRSSWRYGYLGKRMIGPRREALEKIERVD